MVQFKLEGGRDCLALKVSEFQARLEAKELDLEAGLGAPSAAKTPPGTPSPHAQRSPKRLPALGKATRRERRLHDMQHRLAQVGGRAVCWGRGCPVGRVLGSGVVAALRTTLLSSNAAMLCCRFCAIVHKLGCCWLPVPRLQAEAAVEAAREAVEAKRAEVLEGPPCPSFLVTFK